MSSRFPVLIAAAAVCAVLACPTRSEADPIAITGGFVGTVNGQDLPGFTVTGSDSRFTGILAIGGHVSFVFTAGDVVTLDNSFPVTMLPRQPTTQIVNGIAYPDAFLRGSFTLTSAPFVATPVADGGSGFRFTTTFNMTGELSGFSTFAGGDASRLFSVPIVGSGIAGVSGTVCCNPQTYIGQSVGFQFAPPAPTPEPASIVLFGTALLGGLLRGVTKRRQRRASASHG